MWFTLISERHLTQYLTMNCYLSFSPWASLEIYGNGLKTTCATGSTLYRLNVCYLSFSPWASLEIYGNSLKTTCATGSTLYQLNV